MDTSTKIDKILQGQNDLKVEMARFLVHQENHARDIKVLKEYKEKDEAFKNKAVGVLAVFNVALVSIGHWIAKHF